VADTSILGRNSCGVWTRADALTVLGRGQVDALVRSRTWQVPWRGVYADGGHEPDAEQRAWAAVLRRGGTSPSGRSRRTYCGPGLAAAPGRRPRPRHGTSGAPAGRGRRRPAVAAAERWAGRELRPVRTPLASAELVRLPSGLWITSPLRTLVDCAALLSPDALVCLMDATLHRGLVTRQGLEDAVRARAGRAHVVALESAVRSADGRAESPPETLARLLLQPALPGLEPQVELFDDTGRTVARFDLGDRSVRLAVECDGKAAHAGAAMVAKDRRRDRRTEAYGWRTERLTWFELRREHAAVLRRITDVHVARDRSA
jgi:hypothetical protein